MKRILIFGMTENPGGVESFLRNYYHQIDREAMQFDFLCNSYNPIAYEEEFIAMGGRTIHFPPRHSHPIGFRRKLKAFFAAHASEYDAIWVNVNSLANIDYLKMAKKYGIERRIIHSHNSENMDSGTMGKIRGFLHDRNKPHIAEWATDFWACSEKAADYFYAGVTLKNSNSIRTVTKESNSADAGDLATTSDQSTSDQSARLRDYAIIIHNAIDVESKSYDACGRDAHRTEIGADDRTVVFGNVGRLHFQKNQKFLLEAFAAYEERYHNGKLVLIGSGEDEEMLKSLSHELGLDARVHFMGLQSDIRGWMSAFDVFAFPSVFEGVSLVGLEAQANGLPVLASDGAVPPEAIVVPGLVTYCREMEAEAWAEAMHTLATSKFHETDRELIRRSFDEAGFNIFEEVKKLEERLS